MCFYKRKIIFWTICIIIFINIHANFLVAAGPIDESAGMEAQQQAFAGKSGFDPGTGSYSLSVYVAALIKAFLGLLGVIFVILIIIAGFGWMTAGGDEEKLRKAKQTMQRAVIGLIIVAAAYSITYFVFKALPGGTGSTGGSVASPPPS